MTYNYSDANDPVISVIFFVGIVVMGAFFAMNLVLGEVMEKFGDAQEERERKEEEDRLAEEREKEHEEQEKEKEEQRTAPKNSHKKVLPYPDEYAGEEKTGHIQ